MKKLLWRHWKLKKKQFPETERKNKKLVSTYNSFERDNKVIKEIERIRKNFTAIDKKRSFEKNELKMPKSINLSEEQLGSGQ